MTIVSTLFLAGMFAIVALHWAVPAMRRAEFLAVAGIASLAAIDPASAAALAAVTAFTFIALQRFGAGLRPVLVVLFALLAAFVLYRYFQEPAGLNPRGALLIGFAFYLLRAVHYAMERYKGTLPAHGWREYAAYMLYPPVLLVGPIHRFGGFLEELRNRHFARDRFSRGLERILHGYAKVVVVGNYLVSGKFAGLVADMEPGAAREYLECVEYGLNLYFQFAGYSDVAVGFSLLLGVRIEENFDRPFLRRNIGQFWRAWHMSLSSWCRDYVFMPVAALTRRPYFAMLTSMAVLGVWHELSWRYLAWGLYHGAGIVAWQMWRQHFDSRLPAVPGRGVTGRIHEFLAILLTVNFVVLGFAITKEPDLPGAIRAYRTLFFGG